MKVTDALLYKGSVFTIEWYFDERGRSQAKDYYEALSIDRRVRFMKLARLMGEVGKILVPQSFVTKAIRLWPSNLSRIVFCVSLWLEKELL
jgi:hypothetical protein